MGGGVVKMGTAAAALAARGKGGVESRVREWARLLELGVGRDGGVRGGEAGVGPRSGASRFPNAVKGGRAKVPDHTSTARLKATPYRVSTFAGKPFPYEQVDRRGFIGPEGAKQDRRTLARYRAEAVRCGIPATEAMRLYPRPEKVVDPGRWDPFLRPIKGHKRHRDAPMRWAKIEEKMKKMPQLLEESRSLKLSLRRGILPKQGKRGDSKEEQRKESIDLLFDHLLLTRAQLREKIRPKMQNLNK